MSSTKIDINFEAADRISNGINEIHATATNISSTAKGIDASPFSSYSGRTVSAVNEFSNKINEVANTIDDFASSFNRSVELYREALREIEREVAEKTRDTMPTVVQTETNLGTIETDNPITVEEKTQVISENPNIEEAHAVLAPTSDLIETDNQVTKIEEKEKVVSDGPVVMPTPQTNDIKIYSTIDETRQEEIKSTISFYFNFPKASKEIKEISPQRLDEMFLKNNARKNGNSYRFTIDGKTYEYNIKTHEIIVPGSKEKTLYCKFYVNPDTSFNDITNTITLMSGSGEAKYTTGWESGLKVDKNSLVIIPYGSNNTPNTPNKVSATTRTGAFLAGGNTKKVTNSIVGYSLGGQAAYSAAASNKGLYTKIVVVNSSPMTTKGGLNFIEKFGSYDAFKDTDIYIFESKNDGFIETSKESLRRFYHNGIPMKNIHIYTNDPGLIKVAQKNNVPSENIYKVEDHYATSHRGWSGHSYGYDMLKDSGIISYLSRL